MFGILGTFAILLVMFANFVASIFLGCIWSLFWMLLCIHSFWHWYA